MSAPLYPNRRTRRKGTSVVVVGAGHVGLVYAAGLAAMGHQITVVDLDRKRIAQLRRGRLWFHEPDLSELLRDGQRKARLIFTTQYGRSLRAASFVFICVPTPTTIDGSLDDTFLRTALGQLGRLLPHPSPIVVMKSTVPAGTVDAVHEHLGRDDVAVITNPEFLAEGTAVADFFRPSRIVIGAKQDHVSRALAELYDGLQAPVVYTDPTTAELIKLAANAFLAMKVSFANSVAHLAAGLEADGVAVLHGVGLDPRIGVAHMRAGLGFGGSCLPKDLAAMEHLARSVSAPSDLFLAAATVNGLQRKRVIDHLSRRLGSVGDKRIAVLGLAFKPNTDDLRESPAVGLVRELCELHAEVSAYDPVVRDVAIDLPCLRRPARSVLGAVTGAEAVVVATDWPEFASLDWRVLAKKMKGNLVVDGRGVVDAAIARAEGLEVISLAGSR